MSSRFSLSQSAPSKNSSILAEHNTSACSFTPLTHVAAAYNAAVQKATGFTPIFLHFGREMASQISVLLANPSSNCESNGEYANEVVQRINVAHQLACECLSQSAEHSKRYYDKKV
jgi:hypothetical protein